MHSCGKGRRTAWWYDLPLPRFVHGHAHVIYGLGCCKLPNVVDVSGLLIAAAACVSKRDSMTSPVQQVRWRRRVYTWRHADFSHSTRPWYSFSKASAVSLLDSGVIYGEGGDLEEATDPSPPGILKWFFSALPLKCPHCFIFDAPRPYIIPHFPD